MAKRKLTLSTLRQMSQRLCGLRVWGSKASSSTGSIFTLQFGAHLVDKPEWGEFSLMVYSAWRITDEQQVVCTWHDDADEVLAPSLSSLHDAAVAEVTISDWGDIQLCFTSGMKLHVFADLSVRSDFDDCWFISAGANYYSWRTDGTVEVESAINS